MPPVVVTEGGFASTPGVPFVMTGQLDYVFAYVPSARDSHLNTPTSFPIGQRGMYQRSLSDVYVRGYKEKTTMATNSGAQWLWRRLVVTMKTPLWKQFPSLTVQRQIPLDGGRSSGQVRTMFNIGQTPEGESDIAKAVYNVIFEGTLDVDWHNVFNAKPDSRFIRVIKDEVTPIQSKNDEAIYKSYNRWYPVNGNMHYNEKEEGDQIKDDPDLVATENAASKFAADGITGAGDLWVFDFFTCASRTSSDELRFQPNGTFYWHER